MTYGQERQARRLQAACQLKISWERALMFKRFLGGILAVCSMAAYAAYPDRPIQLIVPYSAGGIADIMARHIAQELSDSLNTSVIVQNKGGANGIIGTQAVASAKPDGYTILFTPNTPLSLNPLLRKNLPYSPTKDLEILSVLVESPIERHGIVGGNEGGRAELLRCFGARTAYSFHGQDQGGVGL
jgi:hypothetical protein